MTEIADLTGMLSAFSEASVQTIRKTAESPPRVSIYDVIGLITGHTASNRAHMFDRLCHQFPEVCTRSTNFKFAGQGQKDTPVTDAEGIVTIIMLLPGCAAAPVRREAANVIVRYLGGDLSLIERDHA